MCRRFDMTDERIIKYGFNKPLEIGAYSTSYKVRFHCRNCGESDEFRLPKGTKQAGIKVDCENCGCEGVLL